MNKLFFTVILLTKTLFAQDSACNNGQVNQLMANKDITTTQLEYLDECWEGHPQKKEIALKMSFIEENLLGTNKAAKKLSSRLDDEAMWNSALFERLGDLEQTLGNRANAEEAFQKAYRMDLRNRKALIKYVKQIDDANEATNFFEKNKIALNDQFEEMLMWAQTAYELNLSAQSENYVAQAFKLNPKCYECLIIKAKIYLSSKRSDKAAEAVDLAVKLKGPSANDKTLLWLEAVISFYQERFDTALRNLEQFKKLNTSHPYLSAMQAQIYAKRDQASEARQYFNHALSFNGNYEDINQAAAAYFFARRDTEGLLNLFQVSPYSSSEWMAQYKYHTYESLGEKSHMPSLDNVKPANELSQQVKVNYPLELTTEKKVIAAAAGNTETETSITTGEVALTIAPVQFHQSMAGTGTTSNLDSAIGPGINAQVHKGKHRAEINYAKSDYNSLTGSTPSSAGIEKMDIAYSFYLEGLKNKKLGPLLGVNWQKQSTDQLSPVQLTGGHEALLIKYGYFYQNKFKFIKNWNYRGELAAGTPIYFNEGSHPTGNLKYNFVFSLKNTMSTRLQKNFLLTMGLNIEESIAKFKGTGSKNITDATLTERSIALPIGVIYEF